MNALLRRLSIVVTMCAAAVVPGAVASPAAAQEVLDTDGTTDFRNPPTLDNGTYRDTIVTGEAVWYAVVYTNNVPYRFEATVPGVDLSTSEELSIDVSFIGPTLGSVDSGPLLESSARTNIGETNLWYLQVTLSTTGQLGVPYEVQLSVDGVQPSRFETCDELPDCDLDEQLAELDEQLAALEATAAGADEPVDDPAVDPDIEDEGDAAVADDEVGAEIADLEAEVVALRDEIAAAEGRSSDATAEVSESNAEIAEICGDEPDCDIVSSSGSTTPIWAWGLGLLVLAAGAAALAVSLLRRNATAAPAAGRAS